MTGAMRKMGVYLGLVEDDERELETHGSAARARSYEDDREDRGIRGRREDRYDYDDDEPAYHEADDSDEFDDEPVARHTSIEDGEMHESPTERIAAIRDAAPAPRAAHRITTLHPRTYNEARAIGEQFREGNPVIMNLTDMEDADAKRLVDFAAGLTFGLRGSIERVTTKVFLLSPQKVKVTAEDKARIADGHYPSRG